MKKLFLLLILALPLSTVYAATERDLGENKGLIKCEDGDHTLTTQKKNLPNPFIPADLRAKQAINKKGHNA